MLAKITSKNQLALPKSIVQAVGKSDYFEVAVVNGRIVLTPVRIQQADAVRAKLEALGINPQDVQDACLGERRSNVMHRVVLDTNCIVSALVFATPNMAWLRLGWQSGDIVPLVSKDTAHELIKVLSYSKFKLSQAKQNRPCCWQTFYLMLKQLLILLYPQTYPSFAAKPIRNF
jgi:hypothetical protein